VAENWERIVSKKNDQQFGPSLDAIAPKWQPSRRRFLESAAFAGTVAGVGCLKPAVAAQKDPRQGMAGDAALADGSQLQSWEQPLAFTKSYYVDKLSAAADDAGPGTEARPFQTIGKAAELLQPGERVVIAAGTYRECIRPARGGTGPSKMISYEAAPGAKVYVKGSDVLADGWKKEEISSAFPAPGRPAPMGVTVWRHDLDGAMFPDAYNPFALPSIMGSWAWLDGATVDLGPYLRRRALVFADGKPLEPMEQQRELAMAKLPPVPDFTKPAVPQEGLPPRRRGGPLMQEIGGSPTARFWADHSGTAVYVRLPSGTPAEHVIEVTTRQHVLAPVNSGTSYIRVTGITFQHAGNAYPFPQFGMISLGGGDHWILENNVIEWANGLGVAIGRDGNSAGASRPGGSIIVRGNTIRYCGIEGLGGMGTSDALIEDNLIEWCGWADAERGWEASGVKFHFAKNMLFRRNVVRHIRHGNAAWWDVGNTNCRITQNVFADVTTVAAAVHFEMTPDQNMIDNNIIWDVRNAEPGTPGQRGCAGSGIFDNASSNLTIAHNLIGRCDNAGIFAIVRPDRGRPVANGNVVANNIFAKCKVGIVFLDKDNKADDNVYAHMSAKFQGFFEGSPADAAGSQAWRHISYSDLPAWRAAYGWDTRSVIAGLDVTFDSETMKLSMIAEKPLPSVSVIGKVGEDFFGRPVRSSRNAGPFATLRRKWPLVVDPRKMR
jgi:hypothetical protein